MEGQKVWPLSQPCRNPRSQKDIPKPWHLFECGLPPNPGKPHIVILSAERRISSMPDIAHERTSLVRALGGFEPCNPSLCAYDVGWDSKRKVILWVGYWAVGCGISHGAGSRVISLRNVEQVRDSSLCAQNDDVGFLQGRDKGHTSGGFMVLGCPLATWGFLMKGAKATH